MAIAAAVVDSADPPPELPEWAGTIWEAWRRLADDRGWDLLPVVGPQAQLLLERVPRAIAFEAVDRYGRRYGIAGTEFDFLLAMIDALETEYLAWWRETRAAG